MKIIIGSDHAGFLAKQEIKKCLIRWGYKFFDVGCYSSKSCDYPDYAVAVAGRVAGNKNSRGILLCGSGVGMSITANKIKGVRAAVVWNKKLGGLSKEHNDSNIICLPARFAKAGELCGTVKAWLAARFEGGRHLRRVKKISKIEKMRGLK